MSVSDTRTPDASAAGTPFSASPFFSTSLSAVASITFVSAPFSDSWAWDAVTSRSRLRKIFWYDRLRSFRNVSWKNRRKDSVHVPETMARNQKMARQPKAVVRKPPNIGPSAYHRREP